MTHTDWAERLLAYFSAGDQTPVDTCRKVMHVSGPLAACAGPAVLVFPGGPGTCEKLGLKPLPAAYFTARRRVDRLAAKIDVIEAKNDCWDPRDLAHRVQTLLDGLRAWHGWHTKVNRSMDEGPCGTVSALQGASSRSVDGVIDAPTHTVIVTVVAARSTLDLLNRLEGLPDVSAERCYDRAGVEALARKRIVASGHPLTFRVEHLDGGSVDNLQSRIDEGCSVIAGFSPAPDGYGIVVAIRE
jgi:hypothetical protein